MTCQEVSDLDKEHLDQMRENIRRFMGECSRIYANAPGILLDIAPQDHEGARPFFQRQVQVKTLDIDPNSGCDYIGDICTRNNAIDDSSFDFVVCTEVLEHVRRPFEAVKEIERILRPGGMVFVSTPFNFRIHGPLPDCWRFTEHGLRELFCDFDVELLEALETESRFLMPIQYTLVARRR